MKDKSMSSPDGQASGMPGEVQARGSGEVVARCGIPSTSTRAITPSPCGTRAGGRQTSKGIAGGRHRWS
jgi:hypothetical protein